MATKGQQEPAEEQKRSFLGRAWDSLKDPQQWAVLGAEWRRGLKDLQDAVVGQVGGNRDEPGTIANPTQAEVTAERGNVYGFESRFNESVRRSEGIGQEPNRGMEM